MYICVHTCKLSWKLEAWYWAYLAIVVCDLLLSQGQVWPVPLGSQFSSAGCWTWVRTSTACSPFASTKDFVENSPRSIKVKKWGKKVQLSFHNSKCLDTTVELQNLQLKIGLSSRPNLEDIRINLLNLREPASPRMTVMGFLESVQNCSRTGENASLLLSNCRETPTWNQ